MIQTKAIQFAMDFLLSFPPFAPSLLNTIINKSQSFCVGVCVIAGQTSTGLDGGEHRGIERTDFRGLNMEA